MQQTVNIWTDADTDTIWFAIDGMTCTDENVSLRYDGIPSGFTSHNRKGRALRIQAAVEFLREELGCLGPMEDWMEDVKPQFRVRIEG